MSRKITSIALVFFALVIPSSISRASELPGEQFAITNPPTNDRYTGVNFAVGEDDKNTSSYLEALTSEGTSRESKITSKFTCSQVGSTNCEKNKYFRYSAQLEMCSNLQKMDCVVKVFAKKQDNTVIEGTFVENYPGKTQYTYSGDPSINLPDGGSSFVVDFPDLPHQGGTKYLVMVNMTGYRGFGETKFTLENFSTSLYAVSKQIGRFSVSIPEPRIRADHTLGGRQNNQGGWFADGKKTGRAPCVQSAGDSCMYSWPLPMDIEFGITLKLQTKISGWLHGRLSNASAEISQGESGSQIVTLRGKPVLIPGLFGWFKKTELPDVLNRIYLGNNQVNIEGAGWPANDGTPDGPDGLPYSIIKTGFAYDQGGFAQIFAWSQALNDRASYVTSVWSFRSIRSDSEYSNCFKGQETLSGIVSTNATMYIASPPSFNNFEKTLDYQVTAPHFLPDGSEFRGMYNLLIRSDVARCIYQFNEAPISATISIVSVDGTNKVATTTFTEDKGWLNLAASNFTFSAPILKVRLVQSPDSKQVSEKQTSLKKTTTKKVVKKSVTCISGNSKKIVIGNNPRCPVGYKSKT